MIRATDVAVNMKFHAQQVEGNYLNNMLHSQHIFEKMALTSESKLNL